MGLNSAEAVVNVATVDFRFVAVVLIKNLARVRYGLRTKRLAKLGPISCTQRCTIIVCNSSQRMKNSEALKLVQPQVALARYVSI